MSDYQKQLENLSQMVGSGLSWPDGEPLSFAKSISEVETPIIGSRYQDGSLMILLGDSVKSTPAVLFPAGLSALKSEENVSAPLEFLLVAALSSVFLSRFGVDVADRLAQQILLDNASAGPTDRGLLAQALEPIACGLISQPPKTTDTESTDEQAEEFQTNWLKSVLGAQLGILKPFHVLVIGDQKEAWEVVSHALGCVAWSRESDQTTVGHLIALENRELRHEVMFIKDVPTSPEELGSVIEEFRRFIDGGFLLGHEEFDLMLKP